MLSICFSSVSQKTSPGLSSFSSNYTAAGASIVPLIQTAVKSVPANMQATTPIILGATAGLRLMPTNQAQGIIQAVKAQLDTSPFLVSPNAASVIPGQYEGIYAWVSINFLTGTFQANEPPISIQELGGASLQVHILL